MLVLITRPEVAGQGLEQLEAETISRLFLAGLQRLHLRKPFADFDQLATLVEQIPVAERDKIVLHPPWLLRKGNFGPLQLKQLNSWMSSLGLRRLHISGWLRETLSGLPCGKDVLKFSPEISYSTGVHNWSLLQQCYAPGEKNRVTTAGYMHLRYNYILVSPLLDSISKPGYPANPELWQLPDFTCRKTAVKLIAMGGLSSESLPRVYRAGYDGAALLGSIWKPMGCLHGPAAFQCWQKQAIQQFIISKRIWEQVNSI